ncbi:MAG: hypothetical protein DDT32_01937 [Syntrophomonadaceae bacterium]|nr:hypothetical protein [Bacillota bacterium]
MTSKTTLITTRTCTRCGQPFLVAIESDRDICAICLQKTRLKEGENELRKMPDLRIDS